MKRRLIIPRIERGINITIKEGNIEIIGIIEIKGGNPEMIIIR